MTPLPTLSPTSSAQDFVAGLSFLPRALSLLVRTPSLRGWTALCAAVTATVLIGSAWWLWPKTQAWAHDWVTGDAWYWQALAASLGVVLFVASWALSALTLPNLVLAPLQDPLSEATEAALGDFTAPSFSLSRTLRGVALGLSHTLLRVALMSLGLVVLFPLNLIPGVGSVLWWLGSTTWGSFWLSCEHLSGPMARHLRPFGEVLRALAARKRLALGFGLSLSVVLWLPVLNFFLLPLAIVGGTLLYRALLKAQLLAPSKDG